MTAVPDWVGAEDTLCNRMVAALAQVGAAEALEKTALSDELRRLFELRGESAGDRIQVAALDEAIGEVEARRRIQGSAQRLHRLDGKRPYFAHLSLTEGGRTRDVLVGKGSGVDGRLPANIVDWRDAPISRLYYDYEEGEEYCEEIAGREREGVISARRTLDIRGGVLQGAETAELVARKRAGNTWQVRRRADEVLERSDARDDPEDHALPDIVALITPAQFRVLTQDDAGVVLLSGQAGSGKTTVALHRVAYLRYHEPDRFRPDRVLVVMFNKALQTYIRRALSDLDLVGVQVSTFHAWSRRHLRGVGLSPAFVAGTPPDVAALKQHPAVDAVIRGEVMSLGRRLAGWLRERMGMEAADDPAENGFAEIRAVWEGSAGDDREALRPLWAQMSRRLGDHLRDLRRALGDDEALRRAAPPQLQSAVATVAERERARAGTAEVDFADAALLLRVGQHKAALGADVACPWFASLAHVVMDEAQDLSAIEVRVLLDAADRRRSVTIAGDPAQRLYRDDDYDVFAGAELGDVARVATLPVGHRATRPIMALALVAAGQTNDALLAATRPGLPVVWLAGAEAVAQVVGQQVSAFRARRPKALVAVLCRDRRAADAWHAALLRGGVDDARRGHRDTFTFAPGVVVSNVHQVKGLEFDGVVLVEPADYRPRDANLLHVAVTRAADQLWVVGARGFGVLSGAAERAMTARRRPTS